MLARLGDQAAEANLEHQAATAAAAARENVRRNEDAVKVGVRTTTICDGTVPVELREWIRAINTINGRANDNAVEVATRSSKQTLLETVETYIVGQGTP